MSTKDVYDLAAKDSPENVEIPRTPSGLAAWALIRFGPWVLGFVAAALFYHDFKVERKDSVDYQRVTSEKLIAAFENNSRAGAAQAQAVADLADNVEENTRVLRELNPR